MSLPEIGYLRSIVHDNDAEKIDLERKVTSLRIGIQQEEERLQHSIEFSHKQADKISKSVSKVAECESILDFNSLSLNQISEDQKEVARQLSITAKVESALEAKSTLSENLSHTQMEMKGIEENVALIKEILLSSKDEYFSEVLDKQLAVKEQIDTLNAEQTHQKQQLTEINASVENKRQQMLATKSEIESLVARKQHLLVLISDLEVKVPQLQETLQTQRKHLADIKAEIAEKQSSAQQARTVKLMAFKKVVDGIEALETDIALKEEDIIAGNKELKTQNEAVSAARQRLVEQNALLAERVAAKDRLAAELSQIRIQISAVPPINDDQSRYFQDKVTALDGEIALIQKHLQESRDTIALLAKQISGEVEHPDFTPMRATITSNIAAAKEANAALLHLQQKRINLKCGVMDKQEHIQRLRASDKSDQLKELTKTLEAKTLENKFKQSLLESEKAKLPYTIANGFKYVIGTHPQHQLHWVQANNAALAQKIVASRAAVKQSQESLQQLQAALEAQKLADQCKLKDRLKADCLDKMREALSAAHKEKMTALQQRLNDADKKFQDSIVSAEADMDAEMVTLKVELASAEQRIATKKQAITAQNNEKEDVQNVLAERQKAIADVTAAVTAAKQKKLEAASRTAHSAANPSNPHKSSDGVVSRTATNTVTPAKPSSAGSKRHQSVSGAAAVVEQEEPVLSPSSNVKHTSGGKVYHAVSRDSQRRQPQQMREASHPVVDEVDIFDSLFNTQTSVPMTGGAKVHTAASSTQASGSASVAASVVDRDWDDSASLLFADSASLLFSEEDVMGASKTATAVKTTTSTTIASAGTTVKKFGTSDNSVFKMPQGKAKVAGHSSPPATANVSGNKRKA